MKIVKIEKLHEIGLFAQSKEWDSILSTVLDGIKMVEWPPGSGSFTIYPESGKRRRKGNGVRPIKHGLMKFLKNNGWSLEVPLDIKGKRPGKIDAILDSTQGKIVIEWETGNISSSHRALNKMLLALLNGLIIAGILVVPSRNLYKYLTDRIGNYDELVPYFDLWKNLVLESGILYIVVIEQDNESMDVPRIPKGTSGRALL